MNSCISFTTISSVTFNLGFEKEHKILLEVYAILEILNRRESDNGYRSGNTIVSQNKGQAHLKLPFICTIQSCDCILLKIFYNPFTLIPEEKDKTKWQN